MNVGAFVLLTLLAQSGGMSPSPEAKARAQLLLSEGAQLFERGAMAKALEKFNQAYQEFPSPKLLFNIAQTNRNLGRLVEAINAFEHFVAKAPDAPAEMTSEAKKSISEIASVIGKLSVECDAEGAEIFLDGSSSGFAPLSDPLWVMPGNHVVTAQHPNYSPASAAVDIDPGTVHTVLVPMRPKAVDFETASGGRAFYGKSSALDGRSTSETGSSSDNLRDKPGARRSGWWLGRKWAWVATGSAVLFAGAATGFGLSMKSKYDSLNNTCGSGSSVYTGCEESAISALDLRRNMANVFWGLSAAAAVTAGVLFVVEGRSVSVAPMAGESFGLVAFATY